MPVPTISLLPFVAPELLVTTLTQVLACMQDALAKGIQEKEQMRADLKQRLETQSKTFSSVEKDAQMLLLKAMHAGRKVTVSVNNLPITTNFSGVIHALPFRDCCC